MTPHDTDQHRPLRDAVHAAAAIPAVRQAVETIYAELATQIDARRPRCVASGRCCRFEEYGHRLYVTTAELAAFLPQYQAMTPPAPLAQAIQTWDGAGCPFQVNKLCGVHALRPFGCRIYFCDPTSTAWQHEAYEQFHARLKRIHEDHAVPYFYLEWRAALRALLPVDPQPSL